MITVNSLPAPYQSEVSNETQVIVCDAPAAKGGSGAGFGAHQLLEAAFATCINMAIRMYADQHSIALDHVSTTVWISKPDQTRTCFNYEIEIVGDISDAERIKLEAVADSCPVRETLSRDLEFARQR
ncbi:OsmC family protein [uncultured Stenotrophomonas sp.]|jgi:putative redox protein|uniref:OsmC family protein n=1 Tax=uncultured Stenotrophomonas sp. TaxID=165438 RepID=UPI000DB3290A|nr:OsmC family protein [uncultured Stenotrophomonas sp.]PZU30282.1 MAG: disulfide bond formation regulator [Stenotrophomonas sp.]